MFESWGSQFLDRNVALSPPAVRMLVVLGWTAGGAFRHARHPVLALRHAERARYRRRFVNVSQLDAEQRRPGVTEAELTARGYHPAGSRSAVSALFHDGEGVVSTDDVDRGVLVRLVVADWPAAEDDERLGPLLQQLQAELRAQRGRQGAPTAPDGHGGDPGPDAA